MKTTRRNVLRTAALIVPWPGLLIAQQPRPVRLRGTIESVNNDNIVLRQRNGDRITLAIAPNVTINEMYPITLADVRAGSFVGVGGMPQPDGSQRAIAVLVFPEAMRGTGEGHYPFDYLPQSTMTNATVADVARAPDGERLQLRYKEGEKTIVVPAGTPIVSLRPGDRGLLVAGAGVSLTAQDIDGRPTAVRVTAGRNGFNPPY